MDPEWQLAAYNLWQTLALLAVSGYWAAKTASWPKPAALALRMARVRLETDEVAEPTKANTQSAVAQQGPTEIGPVMIAPWTAPVCPI